MKMKNWILVYLAFLPMQAFAQFPAPDSFQITVNYIYLGESDWCDGHLVQGPGYCNLFSWVAPDEGSMAATLAGYRIYKNNTLFLSTSNTLADSSGAYLASFYVTAIYENPAGESSPSNEVVITTLPIATEEVMDAPSSKIRYDHSRQCLIIPDAPNMRDLRIYTMQGVLVRYTDDVEMYSSLNGLAPGGYMVVVRDRKGAMWSRWIFL